MTRKPLKIVMIRRGNSKVDSVPSENLVTYIRRRVLLGSDELSGDGKSWIRVDRHYQLRKFFSKSDQSSGNLKFADNPMLGDSIEGDVVSPPSGLENDLENMADLLRDINKP